LAPLSDILLVVRSTLEEWLRLGRGDLRFAEVRAALLTLAIILGLVLIAAILRGLSHARPGRRQLTLPSLLPLPRSSPLWPSRHAPFVVFLLGVPFFAMALADPRSIVTHEEVSYPGRRIALLIDASTSMMTPFTSVKLKNAIGPSFFTTVSAAEFFVKQRMSGPYHDLMSLIEFGDQAYVITPFTMDHKSILLSLSLIGDWGEWQRFPDQGTVIVRAISEGVQLFKAFDFLKASGNLMVIFSDGQDSEARLLGRPIDEILQEAREEAIPVYFIRVAFNRELGGVLPDDLWKSAVERTGGRFYPAADEDAILRAIDEIDRLSAGRIDVRQYATGQPRFAGYALIAVALWLTGALLKLGLRFFRTFP
jgi:Ca-activated chloride channel family protein